MKIIFLILFLPLTSTAQSEIHFKLKATGLETERITFQFKEPKTVQSVEIDRLDAGSLTIAVDDDFRNPIANFSSESEQAVFCTKTALGLTFSYQTDKDIWVAIKFDCGQNMRLENK